MISRPIVFVSAALAIGLFAMGEAVGESAELTPTASPTTTPSAIPASAPSVGTSVEDAMFGEVEPANATGLIDRIAVPDDTLDIGGRVQLRLNYSTRDGDRRLDEVPVRAPYFLEAYFDARPNERVRAYSRARVVYDPRGPSDDGPARPVTQGTLDQLWIKFDLARRVYVTAGRQPVRWGSGRIWNPTDVLHRQHRDPLALVDKRSGVDIVKFNVPMASGMVNVIGVVDLDGVEHADQVGTAARIETLVGGAEVSATAAYRRGDPFRIGADASSAVGPFDMRLEVFVLNGLTERTWYGRFEPEKAVLPYAGRRRHGLIPQVVAGFDLPLRISDSDVLIVGSEYFFNDAGYADAALYPASPLRFRKLLHRSRSEQQPSHAPRDQAAVLRMGAASRRLSRESS